MGPVVSRTGVYLESGTRRVFATALAWPGWCRGGRDEASALEALVDHGPRYAAAVTAAAPEFEPPAGIGGLEVVRRLPGDGSTDLGVPRAIPPEDLSGLGGGELDRQLSLLQACWRAFDAAVEGAAGRPLRTGPRGGGRSVEKMRAHLVEGDHAYLAALGGRLGPSEAGSDPAGQARDAFLEALGASVRHELPEVGPRGGRRWPPRYAIRRSAWHALDHAWEIENRLD